jgi:hypothetical protein
MMHNISRIILIMVLPALTQACANSKMEVIRKGDTAPQKFKIVSVARFVNGVGDALPYEAPEEFSATLIAKLKDKHPRAFSDVIAQPSRKRGVLVVQGQVMEYEPRSRTKRILSMGLGKGRLKLEIVLMDASKRKTLERFSVTDSDRHMKDMVDAAMNKVVWRIVQYGYNKQ